MPRPIGKRSNLRRESGSSNGWPRPVRWCSSPTGCFLDEATASLDEAMETAIYEALKQQLPNTTIVSIGHRPSLRKWHDRQVEFRRAPGEVGRLVEAAS
jgi:ABC-type uncharacterized transport system fused permease/ATPase subunit